MQGAIPGQLLRGHHPADPAVDHDRDLLGDRRGDRDVLLDQQDRDITVRGQIRQQILDLTDHHRRQPLGRLIEHQEFGVLEQGARDRNHLLLAAGQLTGDAAPALVEARESLVDPVHGPGPATALDQPEMLLDGQASATVAGPGGCSRSPWRRSGKGRDRRSPRRETGSSRAAGAADRSPRGTGWSCPCRCARPPFAHPAPGSG